jgi:predicted DNA-binding protein with PD1-like motif
VISPPHAIQVASEAGVGQTSGVNWMFAPLPQTRHANVKFKTPLENLMVAGGSLILTSAKNPCHIAMQMSELDHWSLSVLMRSESVAPCF